MISGNIKKLFQDAYTLDKKSENKWLDLGVAVRGEYANADAFTAIKDDFLDEVIYPTLGDDAVRIMAAIVPRTNSKEFKGASATQQAQWVTAGEAKKTVRGTAHSLFSRVRDEYAWPKAIDKAPTPPRSLKTRTNEDLAALIKAHEKAEDGNAEVIKYLELALKANNK